MYDSHTYKVQQNYYAKKYRFAHGIEGKCMSYDVNTD